MLQIKVPIFLLSNFAKIYIQAKDVVLNEVYINGNKVKK